jgi:hypothetical protein
VQDLVAKKRSKSHIGDIHPLELKISGLYSEKKLTTMRGKRFSSKYLNPLRRGLLKVS